MAAAEAPFAEFWFATVYPAIQESHQKLLTTTPTRIAEKAKEKKEKKGKKDKKEDTDKEKKEKKEDKYKEDDEEKDPVREKIASVVQDVRKDGERRNVYMNLAFTGPIDNSSLEELVSLGKVGNMAADMFLRSMPNAAAGTAPEVQESGGDDADAKTPQSNKAERRATEVLGMTGKRPWKIPKTVEKGFEIPIAVLPTANPEIGKLKRLGMDIVVNAFWLAYFWAKQDDSKDAVTALEKLCLDWPFDFSLIRGNSEDEIEQNKFKYAVNMKSRHERLRDFVGLDNLNLLRIVARAADLARDPTGRKPSPEKVQEWLEKHVKWGLLSSFSSFSLDGIQIPHGG